MTRLLQLTPIHSLLIAAGAVLALTSGVQAQSPLTDNVMSPAGDFDTVINLPADPVPVTDPVFPHTGNADVGDATGAMLTQLNMNEGFSFSTGNRDYFFTEVNILASNVTNQTFINSNANFFNSEVNLMDPDAFVGNDSTFDANTTINMTDGVIRNNSVINGVVNTSGGLIGNGNVINGTLNHSGTAQTSSGVIAASGSIVNISGDASVFFFDFQEGSTVNMTSGTIGNVSTISGVANISGGTLGNFVVMDGTVNFSGTDEVTVLSSSDVAAPGVVTVNNPNATLGFGLDVEPGATVNMEDGLLSSANISGVVNISGGGNGASNTGTHDVLDGGVLNLSGGVLGTAALDIFNGGTVNQSGGELGFNTDVENGGVLNISGGIQGIAGQFNGAADLDVDNGGTVNFIGTSFSINGTAINGLMPGVPFTVATGSNVQLTGTLVDGSMIAYSLDASAPDTFAAGSVVTVSLPALDVLLGDVNLDGTVNFLDISPFIGLLSGGGFLAEADINEDESVDFLDITPFIAILSN